MALFYPLLTFLSALVPVGLAVAVTSLLVSALLLLFLSLAIGWHRARWLVGTLLVIFLGAFSLGMLTPWRGLFATAGGLLLVALFMILWARRPMEEPPPEPEPPVEELAPEPWDPETWPEPEAEPGLELEVEPEPEPEPEAEPTGLHCPFCGREMADDYRFCPGCGQDTLPVLSCAECGYVQFVDSDRSPAYCLRCGQVLPTRET
jgi:hypothetical protein